MVANRTSSGVRDDGRRFAVAPAVAEDGHLAARPQSVVFGQTSIWRNRNFLLLWLAQAISQTAQNAIWYGIVVLVQRLSNSSTQLSLAVLTLIIPSVVFGVLAGVYVDRWDKRGVLIATNLTRGCIAFAYAAFGVVTALPLSLLFLINFLFSTVGQFFAPAETAMIPAVVARSRLLQANSLFHLTFTGSQLIGLVVLGPLFVKLGGVEGLFVSMAAAIVLCGGLVWPLPGRRGEHDPSVPASEEEAIRGVWRDVRDIWHFVFRDRVVALAMVQWTIGAILGLVVATLVPGFGERLLHVRAEDAVFVMAPAGIGMVAGTALLNRWGDRFDKHLLSNVGLFTVAGCLALTGGLAFVTAFLTGGHPPLISLPTLGEVSVLVPPIMGLALIAGLGFVSIMVPAQTFLQERAPVDLRGRVFAVQLMLSNFATIVPLLLLGGLADLIGVDKTLVLIGVLIAAAGFISLRIAPGVPPWHLARASAATASVRPATVEPLASREP
jgi:MFS family permease